MSSIIANLIAGLIILAILCAAIVYIVKAKRKGVKCIGCSAAGQCSASQADGKARAGCSCGCGHCEEN